MATIYWVFLILAAVGMFAPAGWQGGRWINGGAALVLFVLIGLKIFRMAV